MNCPVLLHHHQLYFVHCISQECFLNNPRPIIQLKSISIFLRFTWSVDKKFPWAFPSFSEWWSSLHSHRFSPTQTSFSRYPITRVQIVNLNSFTQNSLPTPHHALWTCERLGPVFKLFDSTLPFCSSCSWFWQQTISRDDCLWGWVCGRRSSGIILIEIFHLDGLKTATAIITGTAQLLLINIFGWSISLFENKPSYNRT